jgi:hypothetical protein
MKPTIIIDFDGVFNAVNDDMDELKNIFPDFRYTEVIAKDGHTIPVRVSDTLIQFFNDLSERANIIWLTTHKQDTETFPEFLGFKTFPWLAEPSNISASVWWKLEVIKELPRDVPTLWIDDDIPLNNPSSPDYTWIRRNKHRWLQTIAPNNKTGITPDYLSTITQFVADAHSN